MPRDYFNPGYHARATANNVQLPAFATDSSRFVKKKKEKRPLFYTAFSTIVYYFFDRNWYAGGALFENIASREKIPKSFDEKRKINAEQFETEQARATLVELRRDFPIEIHRSRAWPTRNLPNLAIRLLSPRVESKSTFALDYLSYQERSKISSTVSKNWNFPFTTS